MPAIAPNSTPPMITLWKCAIRNRLLCSTKSRRRHGQQHAGHAADREGDHEADRPQHRRLEAMRPRYIVNSQLKIFTPVGIEMIIVMMPKNALTSAPEPMVKK
jgi:hypothetical protein